MDLDIDQVFMYIVHRPLFSVVDHISSLYQIAARTTDTRVKEVLIAVAKEFMDIMLLFELEHRLDLRVFEPGGFFEVISFAKIIASKSFQHRLDFRITTRWRFLKITSFAQIASKSLALRLACAYAQACLSAAAWVITRLVDKINDEGTKNVLRTLIEDFNRISIAFQSVCEMIFRDHRPINPEIVRPLILQNIRPWIPYIPPFPVPRVDDELVFSGVLSERMLHQILTAVYNLEDAIGQTYWLFITLENDVDVDRILNGLTHMVIAQSLLEHHFPENIQTERPEDEDSLVWVRWEQLQWMLSQVSDIAIMALVEIESVLLSIHSQELEEQFEDIVESVLSFVWDLYPTYMDADQDSHSVLDSDSDSDYED